MNTLKEQKYDVSSTSEDSLQQKIDEHFMARAIELAKCGEAGAAPNPMVGAVVVHDGRIVGEGYHRRCGGPHAEVNAIRSVEEALRMNECTIYVSLEPCAHWGKTPPCADLIIEKGIRRVVIGCRDPFAKVNGLGIKKLLDAGCEVKVGVLEKECMELNRVFMTYHSLKRPYITLKWAESSQKHLGGKLSSPYTQMLVHRLRSRVQGIMVGTETILADHPRLDNRLWTGTSPLRITIDRHNRLPGELTEGFLVYHEESLAEILSDLHSRGVQHLLVEGGAKLHESFIKAGLYDEIRVESTAIKSEEGPQSPVIPEVLMKSEVCVDKSVITTYKRPLF